ncbi:hypothetical protein V499_08938 [Pseudogymnoascus sp. VKM F-103]|nr:hypothetical protein V499_08938 [Pseudogymnoascus sp. VKM F-103]
MLATCFSRPSRVALHRPAHSSSVSIRTGICAGSTSRRGATDDTATSPSCGFSVAVNSPAYTAVVTSVSNSLLSPNPSSSISLAYAKFFGSFACVSKLSWRNFWAWTGVNGGSASGEEV